ncbi:hypothetical protein PHG318 (plasmid) [Cupriavidus necator H16]|uniref:Uncharacterized protein n=1 Tax=Cupriavidus necator (strain ATCC 17699 / DSM 428 / KCTC 22496 / NCIMB 10442 / H16 / Stanier 337) TaxID=381666 RepID=Q7WX24_CUPNH|nr:hypothetical protein PHG318 [Cupriavidus necator H16]
MQQLREKPADENQELDFGNEVQLHGSKAIVTSGHKEVQRREQIDDGRENSQRADTG